MLYVRFIIKIITYIYLIMFLYKSSHIQIEMPKDRQFCVEVDQCHTDVS